MPEPRRRRNRDETEPPATLLPPNNPEAARAYVCALAGLVPGLGLLLGPAAVYFGRLGLRRVRQEPSAKGGGHAVAGVVLGGLEVVLNAVGLALVALGLDLI